MPELVAESALHAPPPDLAPHVARVVGYRYLGFPSGVHLGMPGRFLTIVIAFDDPLHLAMDPGAATTHHDAMVSGFHDRAVEIHHDGVQHGIQFDVTPSGARAIFGVPPAELASSAVDLCDAWTRPVTTRLAAELYERTASTDDWPTRFAALDDVLRRAVAAHDGHRVARVPAAASDAWRLITTNGGRGRIGDVADQLGWSRRHLTHRFTEEYGLSPKTMASIVRFERSVQLLKRPDPPRLATVAAACGYADQAHLNRDWRRFAGTTPTAWREAEQLPFVQDPDAETSAG